MDTWICPHYDRACLLVCTMQNDFVRPSSPHVDPGARAAIPHLVAALNAWRGQGRLIVHLLRGCPDGDTDIESARRTAVAAGQRLACPGTNGARIYPDIAPHGDQEPDWQRLLAGHLSAIGSNEFTCRIPRWSGFHRTRLDPFLLDHGIDTLILCGCNLRTGICATLHAAAVRDYRLVILSDATADCSRQTLPDLHAIGVTVIDTDTWLHGPGSGRFDTIPK